MLIGHEVGDYLFQTSKTAREKNKRGLQGWGWALYHGFEYSFWVSLWVMFYPNSFDLGLLGFFLFTWLTHSTIDHYSLGKKWSQMVGSDTLPDFTDRKITEDKDMRTVAEMYKASFTSFVYIRVDNALHLVLQATYLILWLGY